MAWFADVDLRTLAGSRSYERGAGYVAAVADLDDLPDGVVATVHGTASYRVRLIDAGGEVAGECSCPYGRDGFFCKHCVAVGLRLLADAEPSDHDDGDPPAGRRRGRSAGSPNVDVRQFLAAMDHADLVELVWRRAGEDATLFQRLRLLAATAATPDLSLLGTQVERLRVEWIEYGAELAYVTRADAVLEALDRLLPDHAAAAQPLLRRAVTLIGAAASASEDDTGVVIACADAAWSAFLEACATARPDVVELARWAVDFQLDGPEWPEIGIDDLADVLGDEGLAAYRQRLDEVTRSRAGHRRLQSMREALLGVTGDTDQLIDCIAEDLSGPRPYQRIVALLRAADRSAEAVEWLERGLAAGADPYGASLIDLLAELYTEASRTADTISLRERHFTSVRSGATYSALRAAAATSEHWPQIRSRALALLRRHAEAKAWFAADTLAQVFIEEGDVAQAWDVISHFGCTERTRQTVADRRAETHPRDAITVYRPLVDAAIAQVSTPGYQRAASLLLTIRALAARTGDDFAADLATLKFTHRRKRNLLTELTRNGL